MNERTQGPGFERLLNYLKDARGFEFAAYKPTTLVRRIDKRIAGLGVNSYDDYVDYLEVHPDEFGDLFNAILINVTTFFRDPETFEHLRNDVLPALITSKPPDESYRIWSAGCASGEEAYSIGMLFSEALGPAEYHDRVKIYATDADEEALASARQAAYTDKQVEAVPPELRDKYFDRSGTRWIVKKDHRRSVIFGRHDLLDDAPISRVDMLMCRNTLMYFNYEAQARIVSRFHFALRNGGYLILGKAEMLLNFTGAFEPVDLKQRTFRKVDGTAVFERMPTHGATWDERVAQGTSNRLREIAFDQDPIAQLVIDAPGRVVMANTRARELFGLSSRDIGRPLQDLEVSYRPVELRSCIDDAHARSQVVQVRDVAWPTSGDEARYFNVQVTPMFDGSDTSFGTKIVFVDVTRHRDLQDELQRSRQDLETAYEELQSTNEELETTNEELQSTVEELETTNEELQSTNEELETMNEELQSTNEELESVNHELRQRGSDLARSNVFLSGILRSVPLAVVVMNDDLEIELWNDVASDMWGMRQDEVKGKHFLGLDIGLPLQQLRQPLLSLRWAPERLSETIVQATNRRGRAMNVRVLSASMGGKKNDGHGVIVLMQETDQ